MDAGRARRFDLAANEDCFRAMASPNGQVALGTLAVGRGTGDLTFHLYPPDGSAEQGAIHVPGNNEADIDPWFHFTSAGWAGQAYAFLSGPYPYLGFRWFDDRGNTLATRSDFVATSAPDGHGGTVIVGRPVDRSTPSGFGPPRLEWVDAHGTVLHTAPVELPARLALVNWTNDHVLLIASDAGGALARWYDGTGAPLTAWFTVAVQLDDPTLHLLVDGTVALGDVGGWRGVFRDGAGAMDPPPAWLAARPTTRLATIRGGRGYAALPWHGWQPGVPSQPRNAFEIVTASGESCGTLTTPAAGEAGVTRTPVGIEVGQDGTVLEWDDLSGPSLGAGNHCEFRWWPALLR